MSLQSRMKTILITGATGLIGQAALNILSQQFRVIVLSGSASNINHSLIKFKKLPLDLDHICDKLCNDEVYGIVHLAGQPTIWRSWKSPSEDILANSFFTVQMAELALRLNVKRFVYTSSEAVFGNIEYPSECSPKVPVTPYGLSKYTGERYLNLLCQERFTLNIIRPSFVLGRYMSRNPIYDFLKSAGNKIEAYNCNLSSKSVFNFVHVNDVGLDILRALQEDLFPSEYHSIGIEITLEKAFNNVLRIIDRDINISWNNENFRISALRSDFRQNDCSFFEKFKDELKLCFADMD